MREGFGGSFDNANRGIQTDEETVDGQKTFRRPGRIVYVVRSVMRRLRSSCLGTGANEYGSYEHLHLECSKVSRSGSPGNWVPMR